MIRTGELTGKLDDCCFELAYQQKKQQQLADKVKSPALSAYHHQMAVLIVFGDVAVCTP